jgi:hypothetical protein
MITGDLGKRVETVDGRKDLAALLGQQCFSGAPDRFAVVDHENLQSREFRLAVGDYALHEILRGSKAMHS